MPDKVERFETILGLVIVACLVTGFAGLLVALFAFFNAAWVGLLMMAFLFFGSGVLGQFSEGLWD